jgi:F-type H+-transporting ATPase subunit c
MRRRVVQLFTALSVLAATSPAFAQGTVTGNTNPNLKWVVISAGFGMAFASGFCGLAQGRATAAGLEGMARNPGVAGAIRISLIIGLAFIESLALYSLVIIFLKVSV